MTIVLNHTIVPAGDKHRGAQFLVDLLGIVPGPPGKRPGGCWPGNPCAACAET